MNIKKLFYGISICLFLIGCSSVQKIALHNENSEFIKNTTSMTWYGIDFSNVKLIGDKGFEDPEKIRDEYFNSINKIVVSESSKYDLHKTFYKTNVEIDSLIIEERNLQIDLETMLAGDVNSTSLINIDDIPLIISEYNTEEKEGLGLVFIMKSLEKDDKKARMFVTFFDIKSKDVLLTQEFEGKAGGFGFRNYWARSVKNVLDQIEIYN